MMLNNQFVNPMKWRGVFDSLDDVPSWKAGDVVMVNGQEYLCTGIGVDSHSHTISFIRRTSALKRSNENDTFILAGYPIVEPLG